AVGGIGAVAIVLPAETANGVVAVLHDETVGGVGQLCETARGVVAVIHREGSLIDHLCAPTGRVIAVLQITAAGIGDLPQAVIGVISKRRSAAAIDGAGQVLVTVVGENGRCAIGEALSENVAGRVVGVVSDLTAAIGRVQHVADGIVGR